MENKKLYRSRDNKIFAGICGGLGEYANVDPVVIRLFVLMFIVATGVFPGLIGYFLAIFIIPIEPTKASVTTDEESKKD